MAQIYNLSSHQPKKAVLIGLVGVILQSFYQIYTVNFDVFSMDYKAVVNAIISGVIPYLLVSFFNNESNVR